MTFNLMTPESKAKALLKINEELQSYVNKNKKTTMETCGLLATEAEQDRMAAALGPEILNLNFESKEALQNVELQEYV
mgnify:CR=1 FL=1